ncbi:MAG: DUF2141 domain-containing protein [Bacteroidota bacterium]
MTVRILIALIITVVISLSACKSPQVEEAETTTVPTVPTVPTDTTVSVEPVTEAPPPTPAVKTDSIIPLTVNITNLESPTAPVELSIYGKGNKFPAPDGQLKKYRFTPKNGKLSAQLSNISYGEFAIAIYQDNNNSGDIDKNALGIPKERYAFSNNFKPTIKAPSFSDCKFAYNAKDNTINIAMLK